MIFKSPKSQIQKITEKKVFFNKIDFFSIYSTVLNLKKLQNLFN
jgi:hypothetical protein